MSIQDIPGIFRGYSGDIIEIILNIIPHCIQKADEPLIEVPRAAIKYVK